MSEDQIVELATSKDNPGYLNSGVTGVSNQGSPDMGGISLPPPKKQELNFERGVPFFFPFSTQYHDKWELWRTDKVTIPQLEVMRRTDPQARALFHLVTMPIRAALKTATIVPADGQMGGSEEADFIDLMLNLPKTVGGMEIPLNLMISQMLLGVYHGYSAFEMVYWVPDKGPLKGMYTLRKAAYRPPETLIALFDDKNQFAGYRQRTFTRGQIIDVGIPAEHTLNYVCNASEGLTYGVSLFESAFSAYNQKTKLLWLANLAAQKGALGTRVGHMPPNPPKADKDNFLMQLRNFGITQHMAIPIDWDVTSLHESGTYDFLSLINFYNNQMSKSILAPFFDEDKGGGNTSPVVQLDKGNDNSYFLQLLETVMDDMAAAINTQLIPKFIDWNFGTGKYPTFKWGPFTDEKKAAIQNMFNLLATAGPQMNCSLEFLHATERNMAEQLGYNIDYDTLQKQWDEQAKEAQAAAAASFLAAQQAPIPGQNLPGQPPAVAGSGAPAPAKPTNSGNPSPNPPPVQGGAGSKGGKDGPADGSVKPISK